ncbi:hypothetical protein LTR36_002051 [Oleoguttula mirabilis]|uniref:BTB domain-containing protein n=1 Tax=Oleoguttula mirabilis TaxID=1507867 RepID=A0AAV9JM89_9PEZI|nr:hypothetical protein LTR36_002051 [Oleoguttula mirabilis]
MIVLVRKQTSMAGSVLEGMVDQSASPLLSLPPELRNAIWMYILVQNYTTITALPSHPFPVAAVSSRQQRFCANILRTCKQVHSEGTPILYGENTFKAHSSLLATLPAFLLLTRPNRVMLPPVTCPSVAKMIRRFYIHIRLDTDVRFSKLQVEESFTDVAELEVEVFQAMYGSCDFSTLALFEGVRGVGKAVVQGSVGDGKYAEWLSRCMMSPTGSEIEAYSEEYVGGNKAWDAWQNRHR